MIYFMTYQLNQLVYQGGKKVSNAGFSSDVVAVNRHSFAIYAATAGLMK